MKVDMSRPVDLDKLRSVGALRSGYKRATRDVPHRNDRGKFDGGKEVQHWDGRQDAHIVAKPVRIERRND